MKKILLTILLVYGLFGCSDVSETPSNPALPSGSSNLPSALPDGYIYIPGNMTDIIDNPLTESYKKFPPIGECVFNMNDIVFEKGVTSIKIDNAIECSGYPLFQVTFSDPYFLVEGSYGITSHVNSGFGGYKDDNTTYPVLNSPISLTFSINPKATITETHSAVIIMRYHTIDLSTQSTITTEKEYKITAIK